LCLNTPGGKDKNWPIERFITLSEKLEQPVVFILGPAEIETGLYYKVYGKKEIAIPQSIRELYNLLSGKLYYIGCDSGVSHCAALAGVKSLVLFGPTNPEIWKPLGNQTEILKAPDCNLLNLTVEQCIDKIPSEFLLKK